MTSAQMASGHGLRGIRVNCSALAERLRAECRTCSVTDTGAGLIVTDSRSPYLKVYVRDDGMVRSRWEYPAPDRRGRIRGLRNDDVDAIMGMGRTFELPGFMLDGAAGEGAVPDGTVLDCTVEHQTIRLRLHLNRQALRLAPHQVHAGVRLARLINVADERYDVWRAYRHLVQDVIDDGGVQRLFSGAPGRYLQTLVDAIASHAGLSLIAALIVDETVRLVDGAQHGQPSADRHLRYVVEDVDYDETTCAHQLAELLRTAVERIERTAARPDPARIRAMRALLTGIVNRLPDSALQAAGVTRGLYGHVLILISWWLGDDPARLADAALRLELATATRGNDASCGDLAEALRLSGGTSICTRAVRNAIPGWRASAAKQAIAAKRAAAAASAAQDVNGTVPGDVLTIR
ncbi:hypothetical protein [Bifidobacterium leontopitheci]|uniref:hypothetical protein n=1 Tax=Bifidobacterium leontopitheci TaxID=2650774 RepID=UPI0012649E79|nr:hypothetical protein [Bifidobacterium leontopitheci]